MECDPAPKKCHLKIPRSRERISRRSRYGWPGRRQRDGKWNKDEGGGGGIDDGSGGSGEGGARPVALAWNCGAGACTEGRLSLPASNGHLIYPNYTSGNSEEMKPKYS